MNITQETNEYFLSRLQTRIENLIEKYDKEKDRKIRKDIREKYKELINRYHEHTGIIVWKENL
ncbi:MAG: hypothetical protein E6Q36_08580 [Chryseobacterium sp.]|nr:MAG: hypothetical protein E6Q36_08580 [Chryseobacterium sp.]